MLQKSLIIFAIVILVLSPTSTYSAYDLIRKDTSVGNTSFYCQDGANQLCCTQLAHRVSSKNHSRCASIVLTNNSGYNMTLVAQNLEEGRWISSKDYGGGNGININCQPRSLLVNESETISSVSSRFLGGLKGYVSFNIQDHMASKFTISWKVPTIGSPQYNLNGLSNHDYEVKDSRTFEDTVYQVTINKAINKNKMSLSLILSIILSVIVIVIVIICFIKCFTSESPAEPRSELNRNQCFRSRPVRPVKPPATPRFEPKGPAGP